MHGTHVGGRFKKQFEATENGRVAIKENDHAIENEKINSSQHQHTAASKKRNEQVRHTKRTGKFHVDPSFRTASGNVQHPRHIGTHIDKQILAFYHKIMDESSDICDCCTIYN